MHAMPPWDLEHCDWRYRRQHLREVPDGHVELPGWVPDAGILPGLLARAVGR